MPISSFIPFAELPAWRAQQPAEVRLVLTNGCFDLLHIGHVRYLQQARALGDKLVVGLNSDASVQKLKGPKRPINQQMDRAELLAALACVDYVTIFEQQTADELIKALNPNIYAKAGDYSLESLPERQTLLELGIKAVFLPFVPGYSTTNTVKKMEN